MKREPFDPSFCQGVVDDECPQLQAYKWCTLSECIYNPKRVQYWLRFGKLPGEVDG